MIFKVPDDYSAILNRIAIATFFVCVIMMLILRANICVFDNYLAKFEPSFKVPVNGIDFPVLTVIIPFIIAFFSRWIKLHDRISDILKIRENFDVNRIMKVTATRIGYSSIPINLLIENRREIMRLTFYKYTSGKKGEELISRHSIELALDQWMWFWIALEASPFIILAILVLLFTGNIEISIILLMFECLVIVFLIYSYRISAKYASDEINQILEKAEYKSEVEKIYNDLQNR